MWIVWKLFWFKNNCTDIYVVDKYIHIKTNIYIYVYYVNGNGNINKLKILMNYIYENVILIKYFNSSIYMYIYTFDVSTNTYSDTC